jgi:hypothetical protein
MMAFGQQLASMLKHPIKCATSASAMKPQAGTYPYTWALPTGFPDSILSPSGRFMIYYYAASANPDSIATLAFAQRAAEDADSAYAFEIDTLGYTMPAYTVQYYDAVGHDSVHHYNIYLTSFHTPYGYEAYGATFILDSGRLTDSPSGNYRFRSYIQTDDSFTSDIYATHGTDALRITIFHEFFHVIQFSGYGHPPNFDAPNPNYVYFQEMSSVWMEWLSTPTVKDYLNYVAQYLSTLDNRFDLSPSEGYGQYIYFAYLTHRFNDTGIVRKIWNYYRDSSTDPITCIDEVLRRDYESSFCEEYERFGAEIIQTGRRYSGQSILPDAQLLPVDTIPVVTLALDSPWGSQALALSLQFVDAGNDKDTCIEVLARDTNRNIQPNYTITFSGLGTPPNVVLDDTAAFCDSEICILPLSASSGLQVYPAPFISDGASQTYIIASTNTSPPISVVMNIMDLSMNEIRSTKTAALPFRGTWNAVWDGRDDNGKLVQSGEYLYTLHVDGALKVGKIVVVRK